MPTIQPGHIAIIGGGFSGTLLAINLLRHDGPTITIIEKQQEQLARGVAYGSAGPDHLLNVRASGMSAFPDDPAHFERWLGRRSATASPFVRRRLYGLYLKELLAQSATAMRGRLRIVHGHVEDITDASGRLCLAMRGDAPVEADTVVLGIGGLPPAIPPGLETLGPDLFVDDPWRLPPSASVSAGGRTLLLGTGLTAIDVLLDLDRSGIVGQVFALSRRGLLPRDHDPGQAAVRPAPLPTERRLSHLLRQTRLRGRDIGWRSAIDELRPVTHLLWWRADRDARDRFLRHLRPYWDVHRHRLAPEAMHRIRQLKDAGRFEARAGQLLSVDQGPDGLSVRWRPRGTEEVRLLTVDRIVNCTGVHGDLLRSRDPLLRNLVARGVIRPDPFRLGIDTDAASRTIGAEGKANPHLYCVGPMTRGAFWEMTAVPDLRRQAWTVARRLANAHWTGEGL